MKKNNELLKDIFKVHREWHIEDDDTICMSINDWTLHTYACIMSDFSIRIFHGCLDEASNGEININFDCADDTLDEVFSIDDIVLWTEII